MPRSICTLPRVVPAPPGKPVRPEAAATQQLVASILADPSAWTPEIAALTAEVFDAMAPTWSDERGGYRAAPLHDALGRGAPLEGGRCLEIGSGTGVLTAGVARHWDDVVCVDLSVGMLERNPSPSRVQADASILPFSDGCFRVVVIGDAPLFAAETARVLEPTASIVWSNALGSGAPYHLGTAELLAALEAAAPASAWTATESEALWGSWAVLHRS